MKVVRINTLVFLILITLISSGCISSSGGISFGGGPNTRTIPAAYLTALTASSSPAPTAPSATFVWAKTFPGAPQPNAMVSDSSNNVIIAGFYSSGAFTDFDPGPGTVTLAGTDEAFIAKYDVNGNYIWAKSIVGAATTIQIRTVTVDSGDNVIIAGMFMGTFDFDPGAGTVNLSSNMLYDFFIAKYDPNGNYVWAFVVGSPGFSNDEVLSVIVDGSDNILATGYITNTVDFDPGAGTANLAAGVANIAFIAKYDSGGNYVWAKLVGEGGTGERGYSIKRDIGGNILVSGTFQNTADFDPGVGVANLVAVGTDDIFIAKYDSNGTYIWAKNMGGVGGAGGGLSIASDPTTSDVIVSGYYNGNFDFDPGAGIATLNSNGVDGVFFAKYDSSGNYIWAKSIADISGTVSDGYSALEPATGNIILIGRYTGTIDFDPGAGTENRTPADTSSSPNDFYIAKYDSDGDYLWAYSFGAEDEDYANAVTFDSSGNLLVTGQFNADVGTYGNLLDFDPGVGTEIGDGNAAYILKLTP